MSGIETGAKPIQKLAAFPHVFDPFRWTGVVETADEYRVFDLNGVGLGTPNSSGTAPPPPQVFRKFLPSEQVQPALETGVASDYLRFAQYAVGAVEPNGKGYIIRLFDLRFGQGNNQRFSCTIVLDNAYRKISESFQWQ